MCGRYRLSAKERYLRDHFGIEEEVSWQPRWNIAPTQKVPIVRQDRKEPKRTFGLVRWGLIPFWAKDASIGFKQSPPRKAGFIVPKCPRALVRNLKGHIAAKRTARRCQFNRSGRRARRHRRFDIRIGNNGEACGYAVERHARRSRQAVAKNSDIATKNAELVRGLAEIKYRPYKRPQLNRRTENGAATAIAVLIAALLNPGASEECGAVESSIGGLHEPTGR